MKVYKSYERTKKIEPFMAALHAIREVLNEENLLGKPLGADNISPLFVQKLRETRLMYISETLKEMQETKFEEEIELIKEAGFT